MNQFIKFLVVGGTSFLIDYGVMIVLTEKLGIHYMISSILSFLFSVVYNYVLSIYWVFAVQKKDCYATFLFVLLSIVGVFLNSYIMWGLVKKAFMDYQWAKIWATGIVMIFNFITRKWLLESRK